MPLNKRPFFGHRCTAGAVIALWLMGSLGACNFQSLDPNRSAVLTEVRATALELNVRQTLVAQGATVQAAQGQVTATTLPSPTAISGGLTETPTQPTLPAPTEPVNTVPAATATAIPVVLTDEQIREQMRTANILLYEDMVARSGTNRYVKDTLNRMGLSFKDDGNAQGWLTDDLASGAPNGEPWDLIILAMEDKTNPRGDFLPLALNALQQTEASVILETWFLNSTHTGSGADLLAQCGVEYESDRRGIAPAIMIMFSLIPDHPLLNRPNSQISLTKTTPYWWDPTSATVYDTGDTLRLAPGSLAEMVIGTKQDQTTNHGTVVRCMDGRLIWQTFSSHTLSYDMATLLWENYIFTALADRMEAP